MQFMRFALGDRLGIAASKDGKVYRGWLHEEEGYPGDLVPAVIESGSLDNYGKRVLLGRVMTVSELSHLPPIIGSSKVICVGLNYVDHSKEVGYALPDHPTVFPRYESSMVGHGAPIVRPLASEQLDYEGELALVIGKGGRYIKPADALDHVLGYSIFNDVSVRDFQRRTPQWTVGKNFDGTGPFGPTLMLAEQLPPGCRGLAIETRLNGQIVQRANTDDLVFSVAALICDLSATMTLIPGDIIVTGTPAGVGAGRAPPLWMKHGDICEVEIEGIGVLRNTVEDEIKNQTKEDSK